MKRILSNFRNVYFRRLFLSYAVIAILTSCLAGVLLYGKTQQNSAEQTYREVEERLQQMKTGLESTYMERYKSVAIHDMLSSAESAGGMSRIFYDQYEPSVYHVFRIANHLKSMVAANPGTESISFYVPAIQMIVDPDTFFKLSDSYVDYAFIKSVEQDSALWNLWLTRVKSYGETLTEELLTYVYPFPNQADPARTEGYMFIDIAVNNMQEVLDAIRHDPGEKLMMFNKDQQFYVGSGNVSEQELAYWNEATVESRGHSEWEGDRYGFVAANDQTNHWRFVVARPLETFGSLLRSVTWDIVLVGVATVALGIASLYWMTVYTYRPLRYLLQKLNNQLNENRLLGLLQGQLVDEAWPEQILPHACFTVLTIRAKGADIKELLAEIRHMPLSFPHAVIRKHPEEFSLLYFTTEREGVLAQMNTDMERLLATRKKEGHVVIGIGSTVESREEIAKSYEQAAAALKYSFLLDRPILVHETLKQRNTFPVIHYDQFENALRAGDAAAVEQCIQAIEDVVSQDNVALEAVELALMQVVVVLSKVMVDVNAKEQVFSSPLLFREFRQATCRATIDQIRDQSAQVARHMDHYLRSRSQFEVIYQVQQYIDSHLHETISLDTLSEMTGLSTQYLSTQFKEIAQVSFIDYLTNARLERASELLRIGSLSVTDISSQVGYSNPQYFSSRFKAKYGVTPSQYRSASRVGNNAAHSGNVET